MILRRFRPEDLPEIADLFSDTIHRVNCKDYTPEQIRVWAAARDRLAGNPDFFLSLYTIVAVKHGKSPQQSARSWNAMLSHSTLPKSQSTPPSRQSRFLKNADIGYSGNSRWNDRACC